MKHRVNFRRLGRPTAHRLSMLRTMASQLIQHERIETTVARAKELRRLSDHMVTLGKEGTLLARRKAEALVHGETVLHKLFTVVAARYKDRDGGYTRILRSRIRPSDSAQMAFIEYIDRKGELRPARPPELRHSLRPRIARVRE